MDSHIRDSHGSVFSSEDFPIESACFLKKLMTQLLSMKKMMFQWRTKIVFFRKIRVLTKAEKACGLLQVG